MVGVLQVVTSIWRLVIAAVVLKLDVFGLGGVSSKVSGVVLKCVRLING